MQVATGGVFTGFLQLRFVDVKRTGSGKGKVAKSLASSAADATAAKGFEKEIEGIEGFDEVNGGYDVRGWATREGVEKSGEVTTLSELLDRSNSILTSSDEKLEVVLASYESLPDYQEARAFFEAENPSAAPYVPLSVRATFISAAASTLFIPQCNHTGTTRQDACNTCRSVLQFTAVPQGFNCFCCCSFCELG
jgi:hypothetical protein